MSIPLPPASVIQATVERVLAEDLGPEGAAGDCTAALIDPARGAQAELVARQPAILCGCAWFEAVFRHLDPAVELRWLAGEGERVGADQVLCRLHGRARALLSGERSAMNLLQTLSGTATATRRHVDVVADLPVRVLDTRKTLPGLRAEQKYAVRVGGGHNHRLGLHDAILIKENHIAAAGGIGTALDAARALDRGVPIEIEVEDLEQLREAMAAGAERALLDNFELDKLREAVIMTAGRMRLEASGGVSLDSLRAIAATGVDDISIGALTKDLHAADLSLLFRAF